MKKENLTKGMIRRAAMMLLLCVFTTMTAWAQLSNLTYNSAGRFYEIWSAADLQAMANYYNGLIGGDGKVFKMMQDIDLAGVNTSFLPIASANSESLFNDVFDGNDHKITGLSLVREGGKTYYGLFQLAATCNADEDIEFDVKEYCERHDVKLQNMHFE